MRWDEELESKATSDPFTWVRTNTESFSDLNHRLKQRMEPILPNCITEAFLLSPAKCPLAAGDRKTGPVGIDLDWSGIDAKHTIFLAILSPWARSIVAMDAHLSLQISILGRQFRAACVCQAPWKLEKRNPLISSSICESSIFLSTKSKYHFSYNLFIHLPVPFT